MNNTIKIKLVSKTKGIRWVDIDKDEYIQKLENLIVRLNKKLGYC